MGPTDETPPGLRAQIAAVVGAVRRFITAHVALAKAEISEIAAQVGRLVGAGCAAVTLAILAATLLGVGGILFLGEWIFGSIGWGVLHGVLLLLDLGFLLILIGLRVEGGRIGRAMLGGLLIGVAIGLALGLGWSNLGWSALADGLVPAWDAESRPLLVALLVSVVIGAVAGAGAAARGRRSVGGGLAAGVAAGVALGLLTAWAPGGRVGAAVGFTAFLVAWPLISGLDLARTGIDVEAMKARFVPQTTIDTFKETAEWLRAQTPLGPKS